MVLINLLPNGLLPHLDYGVRTMGIQARPTVVTLLDLPLEVRDLEMEEEVVVEERGLGEKRQAEHLVVVE